MQLQNKDCYAYDIGKQELVVLRNLCIQEVAVSITPFHWLFDIRDVYIVGMCF